MKDELIAERETNESCIFWFEVCNFIIFAKVYHRPEISDQIVHLLFQLCQFFESNRRNHYFHKILPNQIQIFKNQTDINQFSNHCIDKCEIF